MKEQKIIETTIDKLIPDDLNANKGNEYGEHLIEKSFRQFGAGRSILLDKDGKVIAGNKSLQKYVETGGNDVLIVKTDGTKLVAVQRTDIELDTKEGRELAIADNASSKANITWDNDVIEKLQENFDIDAKDWGVDVEKLIDYSEKNREIDTDEFSDKMTMKFEFTSEEYQYVQSKLSILDASKELAILKLLNYGI